MTTQSAAAMVDTAIFALERARAELAAAPAPSVTGSPAQQTAFARFVRRCDELAASEYTPAQQAAAYEETAGVLRRRLARVGGSPQMHAETEQRAAYFVSRAAHKRGGDPMPYALRTANEQLTYVDAFRHELVDLVDLVQLLASEEIQAFASALESPIARPAPGQVALTFDMFLASLGELVGLLGVYRNGEEKVLIGYTKAPPGAPPPAMDPIPDPTGVTQPAPSPTANGAT